MTLGVPLVASIVRRDNPTNTASAHSQKPLCHREAEDQTYNYEDYQQRAVNLFNGAKNFVRLTHGFSVSV
jgi:hypothetical protein